ncbi:hypothetical protein J1N35_022590 [Gossypium stocksii]|uniref:Uncharacterized protein n=1 Tax=Gossypium stocksii TaxID=47602 RepID=A0A9D3VI61_9ROSI|nr:hypothetical protein J1N35_022590 [Gossypium stocksii]
MCFNIGYKIKKGKVVRVKEYEGEEENKGLLFKELQRWKREKHIFNGEDALPSPNSTL